MKTNYTVGIVIVLLFFVLFLSKREYFDTPSNLQGSQHIQHINSAKCLNVKDNKITLGDCSRDMKLNVSKQNIMFDNKCLDFSGTTVEIKDCDVKVNDQKVVLDPIKHTIADKNSFIVKTETTNKCISDAIDKDGKILVGTCNVDIPLSKAFTSDVSFPTGKLSQKQLWIGLAIFLAILITLMFSADVYKGSSVEIGKVQQALDQWWK